MVLKDTPHFLLLNSDLPNFCYEIEGVVCINAGRLTKGKGMGKIMKITVLDEDVENRIRVDEI
jgi:hypothetical protein